MSRFPESNVPSKKKGGGGEINAWLKVEEVARELGVSKWTVRRLIAAGKLRAKAAEGRGHGGKVYLVALSSLPLELQKNYLAGLAGSAGETETEEQEDRPDLDPSPAPAPAKITTVAELEAKYGQERAGRLLEKALEREKIVQEALRIEADGVKVTERKISLARKRKISRATLNRWVAAYQKEGLLGLINEKYRKPGPGLEFTARRVVPEEMRDFIVGLYATYEAQRLPTVAHVIKQVEKHAAAQGWEVPSRATIYRVVKEIRKNLLVAGREGLEAWRKKCMPRTQRDITANMVNEYWVGDGHDFNIFVDFYGRPRKVSMSAWMDWRSRMITGWCIADQTNARTIALALRMGIKSCGLPGTVYTDHGKDYKSKYLRAVYADLEIEELFCTPRQPWAKPIERFFETFNDRVVRHLPGFCGDRPEERPKDFDEKKLHRAGKLLPIERFVAITEEAVTEYNNTVHSTLKDTPAHVFESLPKFRPGKVNLDVLDLLLMERKHVRVTQLGIRVLNNWFWADELTEVMKEEVSVRYDPYRPAEVLVFYGGQKICVATNAEVSRMGATPEMLEKIAKKKYSAEKRVKRELQRYNEAVETILAGKQHVFPGGAEDRPENVVRLTGHERLAKEVEEARRKQQSRPSPEPPAMSRSEKLLLERGARVLARGR